MGIESLNSAAAAAGFAMVSDESVDGSTMTRQSSFLNSNFSQSVSHHAHPPAVIDGVSRAVMPTSLSLGERVSGLLDAWRPKG